jgi:hypothetical protein
MPDPEEIFGRLKEGMHIAGYSFERVLSNLELMLQNDNWRRVGGGFDDINEFLATIPLDRFRIVVEQRKHLAARIKELQPDASNRQIAKMVGVSRKTIDRDVGTNVPPQSEKVKANQQLLGTNVPPVSGAQAARLVERAYTKLQSTQAAQDRRNASRSAAPLPNGMDYVLVIAGRCWPT